VGLLCAHPVTGRTHSAAVATAVLHLVVERFIGLFLLNLRDDSVAAELSKAGATASSSGSFDGNRVGPPELSGWPDAEV
jgi:hypothetical protein